MKHFLICGWILTLFAAGVNAENLRVRLRAEVTVEGNTLRLSDLLPDNAGAKLKAAAENLSLGRAPEIGSVRVFSAAQLRQAIAGIPMATAEIDIPEQVVVRHIGWQLENETITRALAHFKLMHTLDFSEAKTVLPPGFTTAAANPEFEVTGMSSSSDHHRLLASVRCRERSACGSFLVQVLNVPADGMESPQFRQASERVPEPSLSSPTGLVLVQPGRLALLVIDGGGIRITQPVMPLKPAQMGELVRVFDPRTHHSWLAQVIGNGRLRPDATQKREPR
jgi:hypothetical protein